jgi:hypothetical protein
MAQFKDVFSTTLKVFLALVIISAAIGVAFLFLGGLGSVVTSTSTNASSTKTEVNKYQTAADAIRTSMPKKTWDKGLAKAVSKHCYTDGMNKEEVARALGEPTKKEDHAYDGESTWSWQLAPGKCLKYDGDKCAEQEERKTVVYFSANGNVYLEGNSCKTLDSNYIYFDRYQLFGHGGA